jgi:AraC-like DNA-binding protein
LEATPVLLFITVVFATYAFCSEESFAIAFYGFAGIYALFLVRYTLLFLKYYRRFRFRTDNYFSDVEAGRLHWVTFSFFVAFAIGIMALLSAIFMSVLVALLFTLVYDVFYTFFSIRFINYAHQFHIIERAMDNAVPEKVPPLPVAEIMATDNEVITADNEVRATNDEPSAAALESAAFALLEKRVEKWVADKGFIEQGITIDVLASLLHTNSKYLSVYINTCKQQTFREWINGLRIEEAKTLLLQYPKMTVNDIACRSGFSDKSHFLRQFKKLTNVSTTEWKNRIN